MKRDRMRNKVRAWGRAAACIMFCECFYVRLYSHLVRFCSRIDLPSSFISQGPATATVVAEGEEVGGAVGESPSRPKESPTTSPREPTTWETIESVLGQHACEAWGAGRGRQGSEGNTPAPQCSV